jgi:hypothetical protein
MAGVTVSSRRRDIEGAREKRRGQRTPSSLPAERDVHGRPGKACEVVEAAACPLGSSVIELNPQNSAGQVLGCQPKRRSGTDLLLPLPVGLRLERVARGLNCSIAFVARQPAVIPKAVSTTSGEVDIIRPPALSGVLEAPYPDRPSINQTGCSSAVAFEGEWRNTYDAPYG